MSGQTTPQTIIAQMEGLPDDFTIEALNASLTAAEIEALTGGDDPVFVPEVAEADTAAVVQVQIDALPEVKLQVAPDTTEAAAFLSSIKDRITALNAQRDDGELTDQEFIDHQAQIIEAAAEARSIVRQAEAVITSNSASTAEAWFSRLNVYHEAHPYLAQPDYIDGWDATLKQVNSDSEYRALPDERRIELAHKLFASRYEALNGKPLPASLSPAEQKQQIERRTDPRPDAPVTLANLSSAAEQDLDDGTFAAIDREMAKDPIRAEAMVAALSGERRERYLSQL